MTLAYYNEHDAYAASWLRNLIAAGHIAPGVVDERDIRDVRPEELIGFTQVHMFAGIGIWSLALRQAGWSDDRPIWTGSCPCQPFSAAGRAGGFTDERHLWPHWHWLISQCRPPVVLGEQVASKDGLGWLDLVSTDMEGAGYAFGATDLCAAGIGVEWQESQSGEWLRRAIHDCTDPVVRSMLCDFADWAGAGNIDEGGNHIRQRLYFVGLADSAMRGRQYEPSGRPANVLDQSTKNPISRAELGGHGASVERLDDDDARPQGHAGDDGAAGRGGPGGPAAASGVSVGLADGDGRGREQQPSDGRSAGVLTTSYGSSRQLVESGDIDASDLARPDAANGGRYAKDWLFCRDDKWRAVRPGHVKLVDEPAPGMGSVCTAGLEETESEIDEEMRVLSITADSETLVDGPTGRPDEFSPSEVLRPELHGGGIRGSDQNHERQELSATIGKDALAELRAVRTEGASRSSSGREPAKQRRREFGNIVRLLPSSLARARAESDSRTIDYLSTLRETVLSAGSLLHAPRAIETAWASLGEEIQDQIRLDFEDSRIVIVPSFPLASNITARVGRLRAFGNALDAETATRFCETVKEICDG